MDPEAVISLLAIVFVAGLMATGLDLLSQRNDATEPTTLAKTALSSGSAIRAGH
jgi:hypothetical protein